MEGGQPNRRETDPLYTQEELYTYYEWVAEKMGKGQEVEAHLFIDYVGNNYSKEVADKLWRFIGHMGA